MAARLLSMIVGVFADRFRTMADRGTAPARLDPLRPPLGQVPANSLVISRRFTATPDQVRHSRNFVAEILGDGHPHRDDAMLLTSELAANAVEHPTGPVGGPREFLVTVSFVLGGVLVTVQDPGSLSIPCPRDAGSDDTGGRGLALVNGIAA
ncbi:ATP-binding protein [Streptosporangium sp. CA-135522]|uniref:ATP-binding protein n=1 Tax=Streptosporangium sp. CA-135522 TaxID=3240072 RepID=UPI003D8DC7FD